MVINKIYMYVSIYAKCLLPTQFSAVGLFSRYYGYVIGVKRGR